MFLFLFLYLCCCCFVCVFCFCYFWAQSKKTKTTITLAQLLLTVGFFIYSCLLFAAVLLYSFYKAKTTTATKADCLWVWALFVASILCFSRKRRRLWESRTHTPARQSELEQRSLSWLSNVETQRYVYATCCTQNVLINCWNSWGVCVCVAPFGQW